MSSKHLRDYLTLLHAELAKFPAVTFRELRDRRHHGIEITFGDVTRKLWLPKTPGGGSSARNSLQDLRRVLRGMGVTS